MIEKKNKGIVVILLIAIMLVSACANQGTATPEVTTTEQAVSTTTEPKVLRIAETLVDFALPGQSWGGDIAVNSAIYDWLVKIDDAGNLAPELAKSWDSPDGKVWTVHLQEGVTFHDGSAFNADDLIFCVKRTQDEALNHVDKDSFSVVEKIEKVDDYTVKFYLNTIRPTFMYYFTGWNMIMLSSDYDYAGMGVTKPMGTGPFKVKEIVIGEGAVVEKNTNYWQAGLPKVDEIRYYFIGDMETRMNMLEQGKADIVRDMAATNIQRIKNNPNLKYEIPYTYFRVISMNKETKPFKDDRVVEALKYCIDPEVLAQACQGKLGEDIFFNEDFIAASQKEYVKIAPREQNIAKAKELLAAAGYSDGVDIELYFESDLDFSPSIALAIQNMAAPAGFRISLKGNSRDIYLSQFWAKVDFSVTSWTPKIEPSLLFQVATYTNGPWNESHMAEPEADAILDKILVETDETKRLELYAEYQQWFRDNGPMLNVQVPFIVAETKQVMNYSEPLTRIIGIENIDLKVGE